jgi:hypothetical protein
MTLLHEAVDSKKFDVRVVERQIQRGQLKAEDHQKAVSQLPDDGGNAEWINVEQLAAEDDQSSS